MSSLIPPTESVIPLIDQFHDKSDVVGSSIHYVSSQDQQSFHNNSKCCDKLPLTFTQEATITTTDSTSSLHTVPHCSTYQADMQNIDVSIPLLPLLKNILESPISNKSQSLTIYPLDTANQSLAYETQPSRQDSVQPLRTADVSQFYSVTENSTTNYTPDSLTCIEIGRSGAQIQIRTQDLLSLTSAASIDPQLSPSNQPDCCESNTSVSSETQINVHGFLSSIRPELPAKSRASRSKKSKDLIRTQCKCPNCVGGGNKLRNMYGQLVHFCYIPNCKRIFTATGHLKRHLEWHETHKGFVCPHCEKVYTRKDSVTRHIKMTHTNAVPNVSKDDSVDTQNSMNSVVPISLPQISIQDNYDNLSGGITSQTICKTQASMLVAPSETNETIQAPASKCDMPILDTEESFEKTMSVAMPIGISDMQISVPKALLETNKLVPTPASIEKCLKSPAHVSPVGCETIYNQFAMPNSLVVSPHAHSLKDSLSEMLIFRTQNTEQKTFSPDSSNKTIGSDDKLQYLCHVPNCDKVFNQKKSLKRHLRLHSGESNFVCKYCDKSFTRKDTLYTHIRRHENDKGNELNNNKDVDNEITPKKFACQIIGCEKIYSSNSHLNTHLKQYHRIQPYVCTWPSCDEKFDQNLEFRKHMKKHTAEKNLVCSYCNKECANDAKLKTHIYRIHENPIHMRS